MSDRTLGIIAIIIIFIAGFMVGWFTKPDIALTRVLRSIERDTIYVPAAPVKIENARPKIIIRDRIDTLLEEKYTLALDTIIQKDTFRIYTFIPENVQTLLFNPAPRPVYIEYVPVKRGFWTDVGTHGAAALAGFGLGKIF